MNCFNCGEEIGISDDYAHVCQKCIDAIKGSKKIGELSPRDAVIAMLDGATLVNKYGGRCGWKEDKKAFVGLDVGNFISTFDGYRYLSDTEVSE